MLRLGAAPTAFVAVPAFDPALGTLDRVRVEIDGVISLGYVLAGVFFLQFFHIWPFR